MALERYTNEELDAIVRRHQDMVYRVARLNTRSAADADDVFQQVFLELVRLSERCKDEEHLKRWLLKRTMQRCKDMYRTAWFKHTAALEEGAFGEEDENLGPAVWQDGDLPEDPIGSMTVAAVKKLPDKLREVVYLFYYEEYSVRETAAILQIAEGAVRTRLNRARDALKKQLGGKIYGQ